MLGDTLEAIDELPVNVNLHKLNRASDVAEAECVEEAFEHSVAVVLRAHWLQGS